MQQHAFGRNVRRPLAPGKAAAQLTRMPVRVGGRTFSASQGHVRLGGRLFRCALGRSGCRAVKREGDGATPMGIWRPVGVLYRSDRLQRPRTLLQVLLIRPADGWCDAPTDRNYNRAVSLPYSASTEMLWRADSVYDIIVVLNHNACPRRRNGGSAIFIHLARPGYTPTEGCIALSHRDLRQLLALIGPYTTISIGQR